MAIWCFWATTGPLLAWWDYLMNLCRLFIPRSTPRDCPLSLNPQLLRFYCALYQINKCQIMTKKITGLGRKKGSLTCPARGSMMMNAIALWCLGVKAHNTKVLLIFLSVCCLSPTPSPCLSPLTSIIFPFINCTRAKTGEKWKTKCKENSGVLGWMM